jgi:hypothetical protein
MLPKANFFPTLLDSGESIFRDFKFEQLHEYSQNSKPLLDMFPETRTRRSRWSVRLGTQRSRPLVENINFMNTKQGKNLDQPCTDRQ